jgi:hypothetical protein
LTGERAHYVVQVQRSQSQPGNARDVENEAKASIRGLADYGEILIQSDRDGPSIAAARMR